MSRSADERSILWYAFKLQEGTTIYCPERRRSVSATDRASGWLEMKGTVSHDADISPGRIDPASSTFLTARAGAAMCGGSVLLVVSIPNISFVMMPDGIRGMQ